MLYIFDLCSASVAYKLTNKSHIDIIQYEWLLLEWMNVNDGRPFASFVTLDPAQPNEAGAWLPIKSALIQPCHHRS